MGAKYAFSIIGRRDANELPNWQRILKLAERIVDRTVGDLIKVMLLNMETEIEQRFDICDTALHHMQPHDILFYYPESGDRCVSFCAHEQFWEFTICIPVTDNDLDDATAEEILVDLWTSLESINPIFAVAGEELSITQEEAQGIVNGKISPLELDLCDLAITSAEIPMKTEHSVRMTTVGKVFRKRFFFELIKKT